MYARLKGDGKPHASASTMRLHPGAVLAANSITNALLALNSAANFAIYCLVGKKFRRILRRRVLRCGRSSPADDTTAPAVAESVAPTPAAPDGSYAGSQPAGRTAETVLRSTDADADSNCRKASIHVDGNRTVVVVVSAIDAAETACSSPTTPSADEELTALPVDVDQVEHDTELQSDLDLELAAAVRDGDDDDDDGQRRSDSLDFSGDVV